MVDWYTTDWLVGVLGLKVVPAVLGSAFTANSTMFCVPGTLVKITSPVLFNPNTLFEVVVAALEAFKLVNRKPELPAVPWVISNLLAGEDAPIPTFPLLEIFSLEDGEVSPGPTVEKSNETGTEVVVTGPSTLVIILALFPNPVPELPLKSKEEITLAEIHRFFDGAIALLPCASINFYEPCSDCKNESECLLRHGLIAIRNETLKAMEGITIASLEKK